MAIVPRNAAAGPSRARANVSPDLEDEDDERQTKPQVENEEGWTVDTFRDYPIEKGPSTSAAVSRFIEKAKEVLKRIDDGLEKTKIVAEMVEDASPDDPMIEELEQRYMQSLDRKRLAEIKIEVLTQLSMQLRQNQPLITPMATYEQETKRLEQEYMAKTPRQKFLKNEDYSSFRSAIWEVNNSNTACPAMSTWLERAEGDVSDSDDDVEIGGQTQSYKCPITLGPLQGAMTCSACKHSYSGAAIKDLIAQAVRGKRKGAPVQTKCPLAGCQQMVTPENLKDDPALQRRADKYYQRQKRRDEAESDDDDE